MALRQKDKQEHKHEWVVSNNTSEQRCSCGSVLISRSEFQRRKKEWEDYRVKVKQTHAYQRYQQQRAAYLLGDMGFVNGCATQAKRELIFGEDGKISVKSEFISLEEPHFPDPSTWLKYIIAVDIVNAAKEIFS